MATADWYGTTPITHSKTWRCGNAGWRGSRRVRPDGTVRFRGRTFVPDADVVTKPEPGEWLLFSDYNGEDRFVNEWTAPVDPDGFIRRVFWHRNPEKEDKEAPR